MKSFLAPLLALPLLGGCIFLTPPTGLRLGDHSQEFAHLQASEPSVTTIKFQTYRAPDFTLIYPEHWGLGKRQDVALTEKVKARVSAGQAATNGEAEGVTVVTIDDPLDPDPAKALAELGTFVKSSLQQSYAKDFKVVNEAKAKLGGKEGLFFEATGADENGVAYHLLSQATMHEGKGYVVTISTIERVFDTFRPMYEHILANFTFVEAAQDATASGEATATGEAKASPEAIATP